MPPEIPAKKKKKDDNRAPLILTSEQFKKFHKEKEAEELRIKLEKENRKKERE